MSPTEYSSYSFKSTSELTKKWQDQKVTLLEKIAKKSWFALDVLKPEINKQSIADALNSLEDKGLDKGD